MYNTIQTDVLTLFTSFFQKNSDLHEYPTRRANDLHIPRSRTNVRTFSIRISGAKLWNSIPEIVRESQTLLSFKHALKQYLYDRV